jgi:hypothetical protein
LVLVDVREVDPELPGKTFKGVETEPEPMVSSALKIHRQHGNELGLGRPSLGARSDSHSRIRIGYAEGGKRDGGGSQCDTHDG